MARAELPSGTVTFLFTDVEGSTRLLHELGPAGYAEALAEHRRVLRRAFGAHGGIEVDMQGDAFFVAFSTAPGALAAAAEALEGLEQGPIRVRMGIHTGTPHVGEEGYVGVDVHRAARIAAAGHGGQVLISDAPASCSTLCRAAASPVRPDHRGAVPAGRGVRVRRERDGPLRPGGVGAAGDGSARRATAAKPTTPSARGVWSTLVGECGVLVPCVRRAP